MSSRSSASKAASIGTRGPRRVRAKARGVPGSVRRGPGFVRWTTVFKWRFIVFFRILPYAHRGSETSPFERLPVGPKKHENECNNNLSDRLGYCYTQQKNMETFSVDSGWERIRAPPFRTGPILHPGMLEEPGPELVGHHEHDVGASITHRRSIPHLFSSPIRMRKMPAAVNGETGTQIRSGKR